MSPTASVRERLRAYGITPHKSLGQNFLTDDQIARRIVSEAQLRPDHVAIEIGPGIGALTRHLVGAARHVIAIELDQSLIPILQTELGTTPNLTIIHADALKVDFAAALEAVAPERPPVTFVGNLPYYITSAAIRRMLESALTVRVIVLTVQLEVAQRMMAQPGDMSLLALSVQFYGRPELLLRINPSNFYPLPDVDSAVVRITPHAGGPLANADTLFTLARAGFSQRRKQLRNTLSVGLRLPKPEAEELLDQCSIDPARRAETLSLAEWACLSESYEVYMEKRSPSLDNDSAINAGDAAPNAENTTDE